MERCGTGGCNPSWWHQTKHVDEFKYLGSVVQSNGDNGTESPTD